MEMNYSVGTVLLWMRNEGFCFVDRIIFQEISENVIFLIQLIKDDGDPMLDFHSHLFPVASDFFCTGPVRNVVKPNE